ncbi:hypothetical protein NQ314_001713 [Rhamnusium bicolor]|uniref:Conserved oligomeric Golgi complex subunit 7 n=1 Tax=Rhamnusium bicolor TaxID=1586634 RepID=A0AAV8ZRM6_9CUCU|nr:hypothetical protein NQ314_001713 [Rhamnusium bicolor]
MHSIFILELSQTYVRIFTSIGRLPQLMKYYHKCQKDILLKKWRNQLEIEQDESAIQWIHNYYNILLSNWHTQYRWFNQVFANESAPYVLIDIYTDVLTSLDPSLNECIDAALKQVSEKLPFLYDVKQTTKQFCDSLVNVIEQTIQGKLLFSKSLLMPYVLLFSHYIDKTTLEISITKQK